MYNDSSSNPITAIQGVGMLLGGLQSGLASAMSPGVDYRVYKGGGVSVADYNAVVHAHNDLAQQVRRLELLVQLKDMELRLLKRER